MAPSGEIPQDQPVAIVLSRQALPTLDRSKYASAAGVHKVGNQRKNSLGWDRTI